MIGAPASFLFFFLVRSLEIQEKTILPRERDCLPLHPLKLLESIMSRLGEIGNWKVKMGNSQSSSSAPAQGSARAGARDDKVYVSSKEL